MASMIVPGHDRDAIEVEHWIVQCQGCGKEYQHVEGRHDGYCDTCNGDLVVEAIAEQDTYEPTERDLLELSRFLQVSPEIDVVGYDDVRGALDELALAEWQSETA